MYARVNTMQYQSGKVGEAFQIFRESILSETRRQAGFQGITVLLDSGTDKAVIITHWQTEADARASGAGSNYMQAQLSKPPPSLQQHQSSKSMRLFSKSKRAVRDSERKSEKF